LIILGGGGLFHDYWESELEDILTERQTGQAYYASVPLLAQMVGVPCSIYAVGVGPLRTASSQALARMAFELAEDVSVRDEDSLANVRSLDGLSAAAKARVRLGADPVFTLQSAEDRSVCAVLHHHGIPPDSPILGVSLRDWETGEGRVPWPVEVADALDRYLASSSASVVFIPFQIASAIKADDLSVSRLVRSKMVTQERTWVIDDLMDPSLVSGLISRLDGLLAMRYHAILMAVRNSVPVLGLAYDPKVASLLERVGAGSAVLPPAGWNRDLIHSRLLDLNRPGCWPIPGGLISAAGDLAHENAEATAALAGRVPSPTERAVEILRHRALVSVTSAQRATQSTAQAAILRSQRDKLLFERNRIERDLSSLRSTLGVRVLSAYWEFIKNIFPEDSTGRELYRHAMDLLGALLEEVGARQAGDEAAALGLPIQQRMEILRASAAEVRTLLATSDARVDLVRFDERVRTMDSSQVVAIFSTTQLIQSEGQRPTNIALELAHRGIPVVFCYWRWDESPWTVQERLDEGILQLPIDVVLAHPSELLDAFPKRERIAMFGFPFRKFFPLVASANASGWITVYDVVDDWEGFCEVGMAPWFDAQFEAHLINAADVVFTVKRSLSEKALRLGREEVALIPNGVRKGIEQHSGAQDLERGDITLGYFGHLSPAWIDWGLLVEAARRRPNWRFHIIGYGETSKPTAIPGNLKLIGRVPQELLASYAANWDVGLVPFKPGKVSDGADAIKIYEYLAMDLPVVVTGIDGPDGSEGLVTKASGVDDLLSRVQDAARTRARGIDARRRFVAETTWDRRVDDILRTVEQGKQRVSEKRRLFGVDR
jgi:polysaccharide pyruvyl transferase WcaK-like protein/glycosyltransferase involved in cell wall biosynthesis